MIAKKLSGLSRVLLTVIFVVELTGCGTLLYPERRGQRGGSVDAGVAILDGIGLLFGIIPGVIAFAVDFSNGTIYLPGTLRVSNDLKDMKQVKFDPKHSTMTSIAMIIKKETGKDVSFDQDNIQLTKLSSTDEMLVYFNKSYSTVNHTEVALLSKK